MKTKLNKKVMSSEVYQLRKRVMAMIYEAKRLVPSLPRVTVRITDDHASTLAIAVMERDYIEVTERAVTCDDFDLRTIVYHELLHAVYGVEHDDQCPLMRPVHLPLSKEMAQRIFTRYAKEVRS